MKNPERVLRALAHFNVAGDCGDCFYGELGGLQSENQRERIIHTRICIDQ
jgi:hypothetical protein